MGAGPTTKWDTATRAYYHQFHQTIWYRAQSPSEYSFHCQISALASVLGFRFETTAQIKYYNSLVYVLFLKIAIFKTTIYIQKYSLFFSKNAQQSHLLDLSSLKVDVSID